MRRMNILPDQGANTKFRTCPNCGAPIDSEKCGYCGSIFYDFVNIQSDALTYIRMKIMGVLHIFRAVVEDVEIYQDDYGTSLYADNYPIYTEPMMPEITLRMRVVSETMFENKSVANG